MKTFKEFLTEEEEGLEPTSYWLWHHPSGTLKRTKSTLSTSQIEDFINEHPEHFDDHTVRTVKHMNKSATHEELGYNKITGYEIGPQFVSMHLNHKGGLDVGGYGEYDGHAVPKAQEAVKKLLAKEPGSEEYLRIHYFDRHGSSQLHDNIRAKHFLQYPVSSLHKNAYRDKEL